MSTFEFELHVEVWKSFAQSKVFLFSQDNSDKELRTPPPPQVCFGIAACSTMSEMFCHKMSEICANIFKMSSPNPVDASK